MKLKRFLSFSLLFITLGLYLTGYHIFTYGLGFPDGHLTDYDRVIKQLSWGFALPFLALAMNFGYLGYFASKKDIFVPLRRSIIWLLLLIGLFLFLEHFFFSILNHGQGG